MPQFDPSVFAPQIFWLAITFTALYFILARVALPAVAAVMEERGERIADDLDAAETLRKEARGVEEAYEAALAEARADAIARVAETKQAMHADMDRRTEALEAKLAEQAAEAEGAIAQAKQDAVADIERIAIETCSALVERLIHVSPDPDSVAAAVKAELANGGAAG